MAVQRLLVVADAGRRRRAPLRQNPRIARIDLDRGALMP